MFSYLRHNYIDIVVYNKRNKFNSNECVIYICICISDEALYVI